MTGARYIKPQGELRQSQVVMTFGPGSMVGLPKHSVLIAGLDYWSGGGTEIFEARLAAKAAKLLDLPSVRLVTPPPADDDPLGSNPKHFNFRSGSSLKTTSGIRCPCPTAMKRYGRLWKRPGTIDAISGDDLTRFVVTLKRDHGLGSNTILHNAVIVAQFLKRHGRSGITRELQLPERITPLVKVYRREELARFFAVCSDQERALFATFLLTGFREQEVMFLYWSDVNFELRTVRATAKPELGFYPKRWEDREVPAPAELMDELRKHTHRPNSQLVFPSPTGNREQHMLDHCKSIATRAKLDPTKFDLKTFRSTYATGMLRRGFDVRTVQHWMGHKSLETTMRYLAPATDVHDEVDLVTIPSVGKANPAPRKSAARESRSSRKARSVQSHAAGK